VAGVDWITATARAGPRANEMYAVGDRQLALQECLLQQSRAGSRHQYVIWGCGDARVGIRDKDILVELVGEAARMHWREVAQAADNVSRLDIQTTIRFDPAEPEHGSEIYAGLCAENVDRARPRWLSAVLKDERAETIFVGSPRSERRLRLYDKAAQDPQGGYDGSWRYEVQLRDESALDMALRLLLQRDVPAAVAASVSAYLRKHGIEPRFTADGTPQWVSQRRNETSDERKLRWLREQVFQTVRGLAERGYGTEALSALGVPWDVAEQVVSDGAARTAKAQDERLLHADRPGGVRGDALRPGELRQRAAERGVAERPLAADDGVRREGGSGQRRDHLS
jgi:hypothetical protein